MIFARNNIELTSTEYNELRTFNLDGGVFAGKLTIQLLSTPPNEPSNFKYGPAILQVTEGEEHTYENELNSEQFLELGFNSRGFITPITGMRLRLPTEQEMQQAVKPAFLHFVFYG